MITQKTSTHASLSLRYLLFQTKFALTGLTLVLLSVAGLPNPGAQAQQETSQTQPAAPQSTVVLYVNPATGQDQSGVGRSEASPYRTITYALQQAQPGTTIALAPGTYSTESGETFPLVFKPRITLQGVTANQGEAVVIQGGGAISSSYFGPQNATILTNYNSPDGKIVGVTVTNPNKRGTGVWIESTNTVVSDSTFKESAREGIFATGSATPTVENSIFIDNVANGISVTNSAKGEFRNNRFQSTGFGMAIGGTATSSVISNLFTENRTGIVLSGSAQPVLRQNVFEENEKAVASVAFSQAKPNLGTQDSPGQNIFRGNTDYDIYNAARDSLVTGPA
jgi:parallel beta-helix repeat protein